MSEAITIYKRSDDEEQIPDTKEVNHMLVRAY